LETLAAIGEALGSDVTGLIYGKKPPEAGGWKRYQKKYAAAAVILMALAAALALYGALRIPALKAQISTYYILTTRISFIQDHRLAAGNGGLRSPDALSCELLGRYKNKNAVGAHCASVRFGSGHSSTVLCCVPLRDWRLAAHAESLHVQHCVSLLSAFHPSRNGDVPGAQQIADSKTSALPDGRADALPDGRADVCYFVA
jgi:hypothetical protein